MVADGYRDLPVTIERIAGHSGCGDHLVVRSSWGQHEPGILVLSHLDTVHPIGFIERLPFRIEGDSRLRSRHLRHEGRRLSRLSRVQAALRQRRASAAWRDPALCFRRRDRQPDLARADRGRGTQGEICAGDRACPRRRQDRHRAQGRRAVRYLHQGRSGPCRHPARGRPQRDPRTRQCHPDAGGDERSETRRHRQCRRRQRRHQAERHRGGGLCRGRPARADDRGCRRTGRQESST